MGDPLLIQKQIRDNNEDLHNFVRDLKLWEDEMKRKDRQLSNDQKDEILPPIRRMKLSEKSAASVDSKFKKEESKKRIAANDYKAWETFDVEKACEEIDNENNIYESDEENDEEAAKKEEKYQKEKALYEKEMGNQYVKACKWDEAIEAYTRAISSYSRDPIFFANRALCYLKKSKYKEVESDCTESLKLDSTYVKAYLRRAAAREALDRLEDARYDLRQALQLEPNNSQAKRDLARLQTVNREENKKEGVKQETITITENDKKSSTITPKTLPCSKSKDEMKQISPDSEAGQNIKKDVKFSEEPRWRSCSSTVEPVSKPPHLRSQKPLKRVQIHDVGLNLPKHVCKVKLPKCKELPPTQPTQPDRPGTIQIETPSGAKPRSILTVTTPVSDVKDVPPLPKTSVQFHKSWSSIKTDNNACYRFLKQIPGSALPDIFKESLESRMFSSIVQILASEFIAADELVLQYLRGLSAVRRFSTLALFMNANDKSNVTKLFEHCVKKGECSHEEIDHLRRLYEMI